MFKGSRANRRLRVSATAAVGACVAALAAFGAGTAAADPPLTAPGLVAVQGLWESNLVAAQDRPDCLGRYTAFDSSQVFDTFRESKETFSGGALVSDPRFQGSNVMFYMHILRDVSVTTFSENGAFDGTYAIFDSSGAAIAQGSFQGVSKVDPEAIGVFAGYEIMNGLFYGGQVLRPSGATIGLPHLVANFESELPTDANNNHVFFDGSFGGVDNNYQRPAVVAQGACPGAYAKRALLVTGTSAARSRSGAALSSAVSTREQAYVKRLYDQSR
jgi:hypothetical protein